MLTIALKETATANVRVAPEITVKLDERNRPEPDLLTTTQRQTKSCHDLYERL